MNFLNTVITPDNVLWAAAIVSFILLLLVRVVSDIMISPRRDTGTRMLKVLIILALIVLVGFPFLVLITGEKVNGTPCGCFLLFFPLFCYYFGKAVGYGKGHRYVWDLVGLNDFDNIEDAQDRLYESRLRFPDSGSVGASISELSLGRGNAKADKTQGQKAAAPKAATPKAVGKPKGKRVVPAPSPVKAPVKAKPFTGMPEAEKTIVPGLPLDATSSSSTGVMDVMVEEIDEE